MPLALGSVAPRLVGIAAILLGIYIIVINKKQAIMGIEFQRSIGSPFSGRLSFWLFRACCVIGGMIGILFGAVLLAGYR